MTTAIEEARSLYQEARTAKRESDQARKLARSKMAELRALCAKWGIEFELIAGGGDESHGQTDTHDLDPQP